MKKQYLTPTADVVSYTESILTASPAFADGDNYVDESFWE